MKPFLSVITPIYNSTRTLKPYLEAVFASPYDSFELILVDDGSDDHPQNFLKGYPLIYKRLESTNGSAHARNEGVRIARGEVLLFLDPDVIIPPSTFNKIAEVFQSHPGLAGLIGSYDDAPGAQNITSQFKFLLHHYVHQQAPDYVASFWTGCGAIRKDVFESLGGFNTPLFDDNNTIHDIEFGYRLKHNRHAIYNAKHIQVKHLKRLGFGEWFYTDLFYRGLPWIKIMFAYRDSNFNLNFNISGLLSVVSAWATLLFCGIAVIERDLIWLGVAFCIVFLIINLRILRFFYVKKGLFFSFLSSGFMYIYYLNCGLSALVGVVRYIRRI